MPSVGPVGVCGDLDAARQRLADAKEWEASTADNLDAAEQQLEASKRQVELARRQNKSARDDVTKAETYLRDLEQKKHGAVVGSGDKDNMNDNKRQKMSHSPLCIGDLPDAMLAKVGGFLPTPSAVMFAVAMTAPSSSWRGIEGDQPWLPSSLATRNETILSGTTNTLDFEDIDKSLAANLTDEDLYAILICLGAVNVVKTLKLAGCVNITGSGLEPLIGSTALEQLDLSLVGMHENPMIQPEPPLCETILLRMLRTIIFAENSSLRQLQLPKHWRKEGSSELTTFLWRYGNFLRDRHSSCSNCKNTIVADNDPKEGWVVRSRVVNKEEDWAHFYGLQSFTCFKCTRNICDDCYAPGGQITFIEHCEACDKDYCFDCVKMIECQECTDVTCHRCEVCVSIGNAGCRSQG